MTTELSYTESIHTDLLLFVFTIYPEGEKLENRQNINIKAAKMKTLAREQISLFLGNKIKFIPTNKPTMFLLGYEVEQVRELLSETLKSNNRVAKVPHRFESCGLVFPSRYYIAASFSSLSKEQIAKLRGSLDKDNDNFEPKSGGFKKLSNAELSHWSQELNAGIKEINWFFEVYSTDINNLI